MEKNILKINITGHRPGKLYGYDIHRPEYNDIRNQIKGSLVMLIKKYAAEKVVCYSGMALGIDQIFIECCIEAREYYKKHGIELKIIAAIPCHYYDNKWRQESKDLYHELLNECDEQLYVYDGPYTKDCLDKRNKFMVEKTDCTIAVWNGTPSGTANCIKDAERLGHEVVIINP